MRTIQPPEEAFYIQGMLFSTSAAVNAIERHDELVQADPKNAELLNCLQEIVTHLAAVSRYLWPSRKSHKWRGEQIRAAFKIDESSPLKCRTIRNTIEHIDELIDQNLEGGFIGNLCPSYVGPSHTEDGVKMLFFRAYFTDKHEFAILSERFRLSDVRTALTDFHQQLLQTNQAGRRFPKR